MTGLSTSAIQRRIEQQCKQPSGEIAVSDSQATKPAAATDAGRNPIYEGQFDGETPEQAAHRLHWAKAGLAMGRDVAADQHARDIAVLRRLCAERDQLRTELAALKAQQEQDAQTIKVLQAMVRQLKAQPASGGDDAERAAFEVCGVPVYQLQCREIGEGDWCPADLRHYTNCQKSPEMDTRIVEVRQARAALPVREAMAEGWKPAPVESTAEMEEAGCQAYMEADGTTCVMHNSSMRHAYKAMLAAAPSAGSQGGDV